MPVGINLLERFRELLAERVEYGEWTHEHCDEDSGGNHRLDVDMWEHDVFELLNETDPKRGES